MMEEMPTNKFGGRKKIFSSKMVVLKPTYVENHCPKTLQILKPGISRG
jgi:hypothetical protein